MATKAWHIDSVRNRLGDLKFKIPPQDVEAAINDAYNQVVLEAVNMRIYNIDLCKKRFTDIDVSWDSAANIYYANYSAALVPYVNEQMLVSTISGNDLRVYLTTEKLMRYSANLPVADLDTAILAVIKRERIEFYNMESLSADEIADGATPTPKIPHIRIDYAIQFKDFASTDDVYMPMGQDYKVKQLALDILKQEPIIQLRNNG